MDPSLDHITVFLDRDGTLNQDSGYITTPNALVLFPGVVGAIARLNQKTEPMQRDGCRNVSRMLRTN